MLKKSVTWRAICITSTGGSGIGSSGLTLGRSLSRIRATEARPLPGNGGWEFLDGNVVHTYLPKLSPVEDYLKLQGRFRHLFEPTVQKDALAHIQATVNAYWDRVKKGDSV